MPCAVKIQASWIDRSKGRPGDGRVAWMGLQETRGKPYPTCRRRQVRRGPSRGEAGRKEYANETCGAAGKEEPRVLIYASCSLHELDDSHFGVVPAARDGV
eukprot:scaffold544_cov320-Pavlova_lutheri.AAC.30